jgi:hypothetical protein
MLPPDLLARDSRAHLAENGVSMTLTSPDALRVLTTSGQVIRRGLKIAGQEIPIAGDECAVTYPISPLIAQGLISPEELKTKGWKIATTDALGAAISGTFGLVLLDRNLDRATCIVKMDGD